MSRALARSQRSPTGASTVDDLLDFARSYVLWSRQHQSYDHQPWGNSARILFEARCTVTNADTGEQDVFYLSNPCRSEWMYRDEEIFVLPNGDFRAIHSATRYRAMRRPLTEDDPVDEARRNRPSDLPTASFIGYDLVTRALPHVTPLTTEAAIIAAIQAGESLVGRSEIWDEGGQVRATLDYPIKTINFNSEPARVQVDTGPLLLPDFAATDEHWIDRIVLAHIGYNTFDRAEFIIQRPTPIEREGRTVATVLHYAEVRVQAARHTLFSAG
jgi:hypothetical protein